MAYVNPNELIYVMLAAEPTINAQVLSGGRRSLYGPPGLPPEFSIRKAILYFPDGTGEADRRIPKRTSEYEFRCYGVTAIEADEVFGALYQVMHRRSHRSVTLNAGNAIFLYSSMSGDAASMNEPATDWPFVRAIFDVQFSDVTI